MLRTLLVALGMTATTAAAAFALQVGAIGRPSPGRLELVGTLHRLSRYQQSSATIDLAGRKLAATCNDRWIGDARVSVVVLDRRTRLPEIQGHLVYTGRRAYAEFQLAGCPRPLLRWLTGELVSGAEVQIRKIVADGHVSLVVRLPKARPHMALVISQRTRLPIELVLRGKNLWGSSDLAYGGST